jgi:7-cyano-7-deazaguanine synthase
LKKKHEGNERFVNNSKPTGSDAQINRRAIVLLSGGLDSATTAAVALQDGFRVKALTFAYGQRHSVELEAARRVADGLGIDDVIVQHIDLRTFGGSALTADIDVPKGRDEFAMSHDIPVTYVPARNTIFLSFALAAAETFDAYDIFIGANAVDYSGYPDCRPEFINKFEELANLATAAADGGKRYHIHAPLIDLKKSAIIRLGMSIGVDFAWTHSCYDPSIEGHACGSCDSCILRKTGFAEAGVPDPTTYTA